MLQAPRTMIHRFIPLDRSCVGVSKPGEARGSTKYRSLSRGLFGGPSKSVKLNRRPVDVVRARLPFGSGASDTVGEPLEIFARHPPAADQFQAVLFAGEGMNI